MENLKTEIKKGIKVHTINTNKFKTNVISIFLTTKLNRENITKEALIPAVVRLGTNNIKTQKEIGKRLEEMYGASFNCGIEKRGDNHILKFYLETIEDKYTMANDNLLEQGIDFLLDVVFNPLTEDNAFNSRYVESEKENLKRIIESKIDNKGTYAYLRCIEEMYNGHDYGLYEYGYTEDLENIDEKKLYNFYRELIANCKIDMFVLGDFNNDNVISFIKNNEKVANLKEREVEYKSNSRESLDSKEINKINEDMGVTQGKLVLGLTVEDEKNDSAILNVYNAILGGGANSKLFQNVREKASLAYSAGSSYLKTKNNIFVRCGIEIQNYDKAISIINEQLDEMKNGNFNDEDIKKAKELILGGLNSVPDEQTNQISYNFSQELSENPITVEEFGEQIKNVTKQQIVNVAEKVRVNTIYFLK